MDKSATIIIDEVKADICDQICKYTAAPIPEGRSGDWLVVDDDSPCQSCPLNRL